MDDLMHLIYYAKEEALKRNIDANTIVINDKLRYVKPFCYGEYPPISIFPPMIIGMEIQVANLPKGTDFVIFENPLLEHKKIIETYKKQAVEEFAEKLKEKSGTAVNMADEYVAVVLVSKIDEILKEFLK